MSWKRMSADYCKNFRISKDFTSLTAVNVAGRNRTVTIASILIEALSRAVESATERESRAISIISLASCRLSSLRLSIAWLSLRLS